jgi:hypothetical protein
MDDSFGSPRGATGKEAKMEMDMKQAQVNHQEVGQIAEVVNQFEKNYFAAKKKMNGFDH